MLLSAYPRPNEVLSCQPSQLTARRLKRNSRMERALVADFLELPIAADPQKEAMPMTMKEAVEKAWENWGIGEESSPEQTISENWHKIVGVGFAGKCAPDSLNESTGTLFIKTASGPVKQELGLSRKKILAKIRKLESCAQVTDIRIS